MMDAERWDNLHHRCSPPALLGMITGSTYDWMEV